MSKGKDILKGVFDFSGDVIEIVGREKLSVMGKIKILDCKKEKIYLKLKEYNLKIEGEDLYISTFFKNSITIDGKILKLEIIERR